MMNDEMSPREFDNYVGLLSRLLKLRASQREAIAEELRLHLEERFAALTEQGVRPQEAISMALAEFGDAAALAAQFSSVAKLQKRRWMMRVGATSAVTVLLALAVTISMWPDRATHWAGATVQAEQTSESDPFSGTVKFSEATANAATVAKLEKIGSVQFEETTLSEVLDHFAKLADVQFYVDRGALEDCNIDPETLVTFRLRDVPIEMLLRTMLKALDLAYMLDHGVVIITTRDVESENREIRVYRVDELVRLAREPRQTASVPMPRGPVGGMGMAPGGMMGPGAEMVAKQPVGKPGDMGDLIKLITQVVEPNTWQTAGGEGVIAEYRGALVISQTTRIQMRVEKLLRQLHETIRAEDDSAG